MITIFYKQSNEKSTKPYTFDSFDNIMSTITNSNLISQNDSRIKFYEQAYKHIKSLNSKYQEKAVITLEMQK